MLLDGKKVPTLAVFNSMMTVPDCMVVAGNKLGKGHGEAKFYIASKDDMYEFYGPEGFQANCFMLKKDLIAYMNAIRIEYMEPSQEYSKKEELPELWNKRMNAVNSLDDIISFRIYDQYQIQGPRGYVNSPDAGYQLIRELALPLVSYIYAEKIGDVANPIFYWKLFVDYDAIWERKNGPLVLSYGKQKDQVQKEQKKTDKKSQEIRKAREGQGKYREQLLEQCRFCPITMISDERLLIASHIKPWAASNDKEKTDPYNGYMLSPLFDKLFDKGFITFTENRRIVLSDFLSTYTWKQINIRHGEFIKALPMDDKRIEYLKFHHESVFKGSYESRVLDIPQNSRIHKYAYEISKEC